MIRFRYIVLAFSVLLSLPLLAQKEVKREFVVKGEVDMPDSVVYLHKISPNSIDIIDTLYTNSKGEFKFEGKDTQVALYYLTFGTIKPPGVPLVLGEVQKRKAVKLKVKVQNQEFYPHQVEGGSYSEDMHRLHALYTHYDELITNFTDEISNDTVVLTNAMKVAYRRQYDSIMAKRKVEIEELIDEIPASPVLYYAVRFLFSKPEPALVVKAMEKMQEEMPESSYTKELEKLRKTFGPIIEGMVAPDIALRSPEGDTVMLSSLRGQVVLIDFWASWCGPCRRENPNVVRIYNKYKDLGFEIYGVSLDNDGDRWVTAIAQDGLPWYHVSDLKGWGSSAAKTYGVHSIPQTFLIDKDGRIISIGLRSHQLDIVLMEILMSSDNGAG